VASAVLRLSPARPMHAPVRKWVIGSKRFEEFYRKAIRFDQYRAMRGSVWRRQQVESVRNYRDFDRQRAQKFAIGLDIDLALI
jgi:hypothetical protein